MSDLKFVGCIAAVLLSWGGFWFSMLAIAEIALAR